MSYYLEQSSQPPTEEHEGKVIPIEEHLERERREQLRTLDTCIILQFEDQAGNADEQNNHHR